MKDRPAATHHIADLLVCFNLVRRETNLTAARDAFTLRNVRRHGSTFARQQGFAETEAHTIHTDVKNTTLILDSFSGRY